MLMGKGTFALLALLALPIGYLVGFWAFRVYLIPGWVELEGWAPNIVDFARSQAVGLGVALAFAAIWWLLWGRRIRRLKSAGRRWTATRWLPAPFAGALLVGWLEALGQFTAF